MTHFLRQGGKKRKAKLRQFEEICLTAERMLEFGEDK
jgi:hypothetical protein